MGNRGRGVTHILRKSVAKFYDTEILLFCVSWRVWPHWWIFCRKSSIPRTTKSRKIGAIPRFLYHFVPLPFLLFYLFRNVFACLAEILVLFFPTCKRKKTAPEKMKRSFFLCFHVRAITCRAGEFSRNNGQRQRSPRIPRNCELRSEDERPAISFEQNSNVSTTWRERINLGFSSSTRSKHKSRGENPTTTASSFTEREEGEKIFEFVEKRKRVTGKGKMKETKTKIQRWRFWPRAVSSYKKVAPIEIRLWHSTILKFLLFFSHRKNSFRIKTFLETYLINFLVKPSLLCAKSYSTGKSERDETENKTVFEAKQQRL